MISLICSVYLRAVLILLVVYIGCGVYSRAAFGMQIVKLFAYVMYRLAQVYKSTGDAVGGTRLFERYCTVEDGGAWQWLTMREIVMARKLPRAMYVQPLTAIDTGVFRKSA